MNVTDQSNEYSMNSLLPQLQNTQNELKSNSDEIHLKINPEYEKLFHDSALKHYIAIKTSIEKNGQYNKISVNKKYEILDGHKRYRICTELNIIPQVEVIFFESREEELVFILDCNIARSNYSEYEKVEAYEELRPIIKKQAEQRQRSGKKSTSTQYYVEVYPRYSETDSILSRKVGISPSTYRKYRAIINSDNGQLKDAVKRGKISISNAYNEFRKLTQKIIPCEIPTIKHNVILASPKWINKNGSSTKCIDYPRIIHSCSNENAVLVLLVSNKHMADAFDLIRNSDFEYHRTYSINTELSKFIIVAKHGEIELPDLEFNSDKVHKIIEDTFPDQKCIELWANKPYSDKWTIWNETVIASILENTPEWKRPMQSTLAEHCKDFGRLTL